MLSKMNCRKGLQHILIILAFCVFGEGATLTDNAVDGNILKVVLRPNLVNLVPLLESTPQSTIQGTKEGRYVGQIQIPRKIKSLDRCIDVGFSPVIGSTSDYYKCEEQHSTGLFSIYLFTCPPGSTFNEVSNVCYSPSVPIGDSVYNLTKSFTKIGTNENQLNNVPDIEIRKIDFNDSQNSDVPDTELRKIGSSESQNHDVSDINLHHLHNSTNTISLKRQKRFLKKVFRSIGRGVRSIFGGGGPDYSGQLRGIQNKLVGIQGGINSVNLNLMLSQAENRMQHNMTQHLIKRNHLETLNALSGIQDSVLEGRMENLENFQKIQLSIGDMKEFMFQEIIKAKADIKEGFTSLLDVIDKSRVEPLVSELLTLIQEYSQRTKHLRSLPLLSQKDEIERSGGYLSYLESSTLDRTLIDIIRQNFAIPDSSSDVSSVFILDWLVHGLEVYAKILSSIVSSNAFLANMALEEIELEDFETYMIRVSSSISRIKLNLHDNNGIIGDVERILDQVESLPFASEIFGLSELLDKKRDNIKQIRSDTEELIINHSEIRRPGVIRGRPDFQASTVALPIGPWIKGRGVRYAIQFISKEGLSRMGDWSSPFSIQDKACPVISLPLVDDGVIRVIYRKFDNEKPERVALIRNNKQASFRDIYRDLLNGAARANSELALEEIQKLSDSNDIDVNTVIEDGMTTLHYAAKQCNLDVMEILIAKGANINAKAINDKESLHFAASFGNERCINYLIQNGANINAKTEPLSLTPLHIAVSNEHVRAVNVLIKNHASINIKNRKGLTPLHIAATGNGETIDVLIKDSNININAITNDGFTPLHYAARGSTGVIVQKLLNHKNIQVNALSKSHQTALHVAAQAGNVNAISQLIRKGATILAQDKQGSIPVHYAAFYGNKEAVSAFIQNDKSIGNIRNFEGKSAFDLAVENERQEVVDILVQQIECSPSVIKTLTKNKEHTCDHINYIDDYVSLVQSMQPLESVYADDQKLAAMATEYSSRLTASKEEANEWGNGNSIIKGFNETYSTLMTFDDSFGKKYINYKDIIGRIIKTADQLQEITTTKAEITRLEEQLETMAKSLNAVGRRGISKILQVRYNRFEGVLEETRRRLREDFSLMKDMKELHDSLDSSEFEVLANLFDLQKEQVKIFKDKLLATRNGWQKVKLMAQESSPDKMKIIGTMLASETDINNIIFLLQSDVANDRDVLELVKTKIISKSSEMSAYNVQLGIGSGNILVKTDLKGSIVLESTKVTTLSSRLDTFIGILDKAIEGTTFVIQNFDDSSRKLKDIIQLNQEAKSKAENLDATYFTYQKLSLFNCYESVVFKSLRDINECTRTSQILK